MYVESNRKLWNCVLNNTNRAIICGALKPKSQERIACNRRWKRCKYKSRCNCSPRPSEKEGGDVDLWREVTVVVYEKCKICEQRTLRFRSSMQPPQTEVKYLQLSCWERPKKDAGLGSNENNNDDEVVKHSTVSPRIESIAVHSSYRSWMYFQSSKHRGEVRLEHIDHMEWRGQYAWELHFSFQTPCAAMSIFLIPLRFTSSIISVFLGGFPRSILFSFATTIMPPPKSFIVVQSSSISTGVCKRRRELYKLEDPLYAYGLFIPYLELLPPHSFFSMCHHLVMVVDFAHSHCSHSIRLYCCCPSIKTASPLVNSESTWPTVFLPLVTWLPPHEAMSWAFVAKASWISLEGFSTIGLIFLTVAGCWRTSLSVFPDTGLGRKYVHLFCLGELSTLRPLCVILVGHNLLSKFKLPT